MSIANEMHVQNASACNSAAETRTNLVLAVAACALFNAIALPLLSVFPPGCLVMIPGVVGAEVGLVAAWSIFGPHSFARRFMQCLVTGLVLYGAFSLSMLAVARGAPEPLEAMLVGICFASVFFMAVQTPLWLLSLWYAGQHVEVSSDLPAMQGSAETTESSEESVTDLSVVEATAQREEMPNEEFEPETEADFLQVKQSSVGTSQRGSQKVFGIRDLVIATSVVAVAFALARLGAFAVSVEESREDVMMAILIMAACAIPWSLVFVTAPLWVMLTLRSAALRFVGFVLWVFLCTAPATIALAFFSPDRTFVLLFWIGVASFTLVTWSGLLMVRRMGYRLVRRVSKGG